MKAPTSFPKSKSLKMHWGAIKVFNSSIQKVDHGIVYTGLKVYAGDLESTYVLSVIYWIMALVLH